MFHFIKKTVLLLSSALMFASAPALPITINYDSGLTFDRARQAIFHQEFANDFNFDNLQVHAGPDGNNLYFQKHTSLDFTDVLFSKKDVFYQAAVPVSNMFPDVEAEALKFSPASPNTITVASSTAEFSANIAESSNVTHVPLLGPIPEPSIKWLLIGALIAVAGLSSGTRGLHEGV
jgi:hypothetical protein